MPPPSSVMLMFILTSHISGFRWFIYSDKKKPTWVQSKGKVTGLCVLHYKDSVRGIGVTVRAILQSTEAVIHLWQKKISIQPKVHSLASGLSTTSHGLNDKCSILLYCHVTAKLSPSADEDCEMRLKALKKTPIR